MDYLTWPVFSSFKNRLEAVLNSSCKPRAIKNDKLKLNLRSGNRNAKENTTISKL